MRYFKCDNCGVELKGTPVPIEDIVVGNLKVAFNVYVNNEQYDHVDLCSACKKDVLNGLKEVLVVCATES